MSIKYYLKPNPIAANPNGYVARTAANETIDIEGVIKKIVKRGTTITETDLRAALSIFFEVVTDGVASGNTILSPLVNIRPGINGVFNGAADVFDHSRHLNKSYRLK
ncbi:hypothetical protein GS399_07030 [Pedobacter sp. HMF7647]|uniref:Bvu-2165-like IHF-HU-like DNA-binding domain-containing protein n=1 Tax=Hufsiella arboris TaxID=2695275 RepID=A0A7K1Y802_9SPHI|nr:DNA-binding domain-containing protein [Hufsiella arboris]MXV50723.1 hypothetical protein [Hufsiella arboris]